MQHILIEGLRRHAAARPDNRAVIDRGRVVTFADLQTRAFGTGGALLSCGVTAGERIAYLGLNSVEQVELTCGAAMLGAVVVPINWRLHPRELALIISDMGARIVVVQQAVTGLAEQALADFGNSVQVVVVGGPPAEGTNSYEQWLAAAEPLTAAGIVAVADDQVAVQLYTSGTSGRPKGVMLSNLGMAATMTRLAHVWKLTPAASIMPILPWFHVGGIGAAAGALCAGAAVVVQNELDGPQILQAVARDRVSSMVLAPTMLQRIVEDPLARATDLSSLRLISYGGSPISQPVLAEVLDLLDCEVVQIYGLTESWGTVTLLDAAAHLDRSHPERLQSCGRAMPGTTLKLIDPLTGDVVGPGGVGEVWVHFVGNMLGYHNSPAASAEVLVGDGWLATKDMGYQDSDGFLYLCDRLGDMIVSGGENIYPSEVEAVLAAHPDIVEVGVVGVPSARWGETPKAFVVAAPAADIDEAEVMAYARDHLAHYKCPTSVALVTSLPRNPSGKLLRRVLRDAPVPT